MGSLQGELKIKQMVGKWTKCCNLNGSFMSIQTSYVGAPDGPCDLARYVSSSSKVTRQTRQM